MISPRYRLASPAGVGSRNPRLYGGKGAGEDGGRAYPPRHPACAAGARPTRRERRRRRPGRSDRPGRPRRRGGPGRARRLGDRRSRPPARAGRRRRPHPLDDGSAAALRRIAGPLPRFVEGAPPGVSTPGRGPARPGGGGGARDRRGAGGTVRRDHHRPRPGARRARGRARDPARRRAGRPQGRDSRGPGPWRERPGRRRPRPRLRTSGSRLRRAACQRSDGARNGRARWPPRHHPRDPGGARRAGLPLRPPRCHRRGRGGSRARLGARPEVAGEDARRRRAARVADRARPHDHAFHPGGRRDPGRRRGARGLAPLLALLGRSPHEPGDRGQRRGAGGAGNRWPLLRPGR